MILFVFDESRLKFGVVTELTENGSVERELLSGNTTKFLQDVINKENIYGDDAYLTSYVTGVYNISDCSSASYYNVRHEYENLDPSEKSSFIYKHIFDKLSRYGNSYFVPIIISGDNVYRILKLNDTLDTPNKSKFIRKSIYAA